MQTVISIILALIIFSILVVIHEFGHFIVAKKAGIMVIEFSVGMGPRIFKIKKGETIYSIKALPLGGSCQMLGEDEDEEKLSENKERAFGSKPVLARIAVVAAGPIFNFILALVLSFVLVIAAGVDKPVVDTVPEGSPAAEAGLKAGDQIVKYDGASIYLSRDIYLRQYTTTTAASDDIEVVFVREGKKYKTTITPDVQEKYMLGISYYAGDDPAEINEIVSGGAFESAGAKVGDVIININDTDISSGEELNSYLQENPLGKDQVTVTLLRDDKEIDIAITPIETTTYYTGFSVGYGRESVGVVGAVKYSFALFRYNVNTVVQSLKMLFTSRVSAEEVSGPVGIVSMIGETYQSSIVDGIKYVLLNMISLTVMLSANLGVMNLLPIPALDGGRLVFLIVELIRRKPIDREKEGMVHLIGFAILMLLMIALFYNDIMKLIN